MDGYYESLMPPEHVTLTASLMLGALGGAGLLFVIFCSWMTFFFLHPARPKRMVAEAYWRRVPELPQPERHAVRTPDGETLILNWFPRPEAGEHPVLVLAHGVTSYKEEMLHLADVAWRQGLAVCIFDFRGHGESSGRASTIGMDERHDLRTIIDWVREQPGVKAAEVGLLGHSMGAAAALNYLAEIDDETPYAILLAPFATLDRAVANRLRRFRMPVGPALNFMGRLARQRMQRDLFNNAPINVIGSIRECHLCFIHGTADRGNHPQDSQDLYDQARVSRELHWIDGGGHHGLLYDAAVWSQVEKFLERRYHATDPEPAKAHAMSLPPTMTLTVPMS